MPEVYRHTLLVWNFESSNFLNKHIVSEANSLAIFSQKKYFT